ncbi:hypothetical protein HDU96_010351 [Phlyctochytrium bullatum]|nr:hypothetical protein HDU96_010351 [Phlyctochytrium bullatum]
MASTEVSNFDADDEFGDDGFLTEDFLRSLDHLEQRLSSASPSPAKSDAIMPPVATHASRSAPAATRRWFQRSHSWAGGGFGGQRPPRPPLRSQRTVMGFSVSAPELGERDRRQRNEVWKGKRRQAGGKKEIIFDSKPLSNKYRKGWLSVTDFASLQVYYTATTGVKKETTAVMKTGHKIHKRLEREVSNLVDVVVEVRVPEDRWAIKLLNMIGAVDCLLEKGVAREIPIIGRVGGFLVFGIIDQIERRPVLPDPSTPSSVSTKPWRYVLSDTKTRNHPSLPRPSHTLPTRLQLFLYRHLFDELVTSTSSTPHRRARAVPWPAFDKHFFFFRQPGLRPRQRLGDRVIEHARNVFGGAGGGGFGELLWEGARGPGEEQFNSEDEGVRGGRMRLPTTLDELLDIVLRLFGTLDKLDGPCEVEYRWQNRARRRGDGRNQAEPSTSRREEPMGDGNETDATIEVVVEDGKTTESQERQDLKHTSSGLESKVQAENPDGKEDEKGIVLGVTYEGYDVEWLAEQLERGVKFWQGEVHDLRGVDDIEDLAAKCNPCPFKDVCEWRDRKALEEVASRGFAPQPVSTPVKPAPSDTKVFANPSPTSSSVTTGARKDRFRAITMDEEEEGEASPLKKLKVKCKDFAFEGSGLTLI